MEWTIQLYFKSFELYWPAFVQPPRSCKGHKALLACSFTYNKGNSSEVQQSRKEARTLAQFDFNDTKFHSPFHCSSPFIQSSQLFSGCSPAIRDILVWVVHPGSCEYSIKLVNLQGSSCTVVMNGQSDIIVSSECCAQWLASHILTSEWTECSVATAHKFIISLNLSPSWLAI